MKIERGILVTDDEQRLRVRTVGHIYRINYATFLYDQSNVGDKVLGIVDNNLYNICYNFTLKNNRVKIFGFLIPDKYKSCFLIQTINEFDINNIPFDFYLKDYPFGNKIEIERDEILKVST